MTTTPKTEIFNVTRETFNKLRVAKAYRFGDRNGIVLNKIEGVRPMVKVALYERQILSDNSND